MLEGKFLEANGRAGLVGRDPEGFKEAGILLGMGGNDVPLVTNVFVPPVVTEGPAAEGGATEGARALKVETLCHIGLPRLKGQMEARDDHLRGCLDGDRQVGPDVDHAAGHCRGNVE